LVSHMHGVDGGTIDRLVQDCGINIDATEPVKLRKAKFEKNTRVFRVVHKDALTFIIDTPMARDIACYPHLVGTALGRAARRVASQAFPAIMELAGVRKHDQKRVVVFEHILRAALGYELQHVAPQFLGRAYRTTYIRPRYTHRSYRDHDGMVQREIEVVHEDFSQFPEGKKVVLIMQDTVASGRSGEVSIDAALKRCRQVGSEIEKWVVYGFMKRAQGNPRL